MFDVQEVQPVLLRRWLDGDRVAGREAARLHYDYLLLRKLGLEPMRRDTTKNATDPNERLDRLQARVDLQEQLIRGLLAVAAGDPSPRPNLSPLFDAEVRAESTRALMQKLTAALQVLERELRTAEEGAKTLAFASRRKSEEG